MDPLIELCNGLEYPLREFIDRTLGPGALYRKRNSDPGVRFLPPLVEGLVFCETLGAEVPDGLTAREAVWFGKMLVGTGSWDPIV